VRLERYQFDASYVERLISGDPEIEHHFSRYFGDLLSLKLRSRLRSAAQIEDAKQETFARVLSTLRGRRGLAAPESLGAFVNGVCNNVLFELYRSNTRTQPIDEGYDEAETRPAADSAMIAGEERERVRAALAALPLRDRNLLTWLFFDERDKDEICREMQIDRNHLRVLLHRAKKQFRERFAVLSTG
jgi:RNA polymerase sigma-70 factor (ECF subfamily)